MNAIVDALVQGLLAGVVLIGPVLVAYGVLSRRRRLARARRRSPIKGELLRSPGQSLRDQLEDKQLDVMADAMALLAAPAFVAGAFFVTALTSGRLPSLRVQVVVAVALVAWCFFQIRKLYEASETLDRWRLGLDGEVAVGQELDQLMRQGAAVFHDFPGEGFNIDHVVIARQGVFAVETKGYSKPVDGEGNAAHRVAFDGRMLAWPERSESKTLEQAARNARWLSDWLGKATGEPVGVTPALALPGWFVERKGRGEVLVFSGRELGQHLLGAIKASPIAAETMQRVIYQVEQRCRTVQPAYSRSVRSE